MVNVNKLRGAIVERGTTCEAVAVAIGVYPSTFYRKMNNSGDTFTIKEADAIATLLKLSATDATDIFFSQFVANMQQVNRKLNKRKSVIK